MPLTKRAPPGSTATASTQRRPPLLPAWMVRTHAPPRQILTEVSIEPVMTRPSGATAATRTQPLCPARVTTSLEYGRAFSVSCEASQNAWFTDAAPPISNAVCRRYNTHANASAGRSVMRIAARARAARVVGIAALLRVLLHAVG